MRKVFKWIGILLGGLVALVVIAVIVIYLISEERLNRVYDIEPASVPVSKDMISEDHNYPEVALAYCRECHGQNLAGQIIWNSPMARIVAPNLTSGKGGVGAKYSDEDWVLAIRHGVGQDGKTLITMPSTQFNYVSDDDLGHIIATLKDLTPLDNELPDVRISPLARFYLLQQPINMPALVIDHDSPRPLAPIPGLNVEYGQYLSLACVDCHGVDFAGGDQVGAGVNLTMGGELADWTEEDFIKTIRTGYTPDGEKLDQYNMPTRVFGKFSDLEMKAIFLYLQSLPPVDTSADSQR